MAERGRQRSLQVDDQDLALKHNTYCLVTEEQATHYGGVANWRVERSALHLELTDEASDVIGASESRIALPFSKRATVHNALRILLRSASRGMMGTRRLARALSLLAQSSRR